RVEAEPRHHHELTARAVGNGDALCEDRVGVPSVAVEEVLRPGLGHANRSVLQLRIVGRQAGGGEKGLHRSPHPLDVGTLGDALAVLGQSALYVTQYSGVSHRRSSLSWGSCGLSRSQIQTITFSAVGLSRKSLSVWWSHWFSASSQVFFRISSKSMIIPSRAFGFPLTVT